MVVRSQMNPRICFRVREHHDVDLILGQGMLNAGWHADTLNTPGKFFLSSPEHDTPRRARAYLVTDHDVTETAARHAASHPHLDEVPRGAIQPASDPARRLERKQHRREQRTRSTRRNHPAATRPTEQKHCGSRCAWRPPTVSGSASRCASPG